MSNMLITGGAGFIGANFAHYWLRRYSQDSVVILDALTYAGSLANLKGVDSAHFIQGDIRDYRLLLKTLKRYDIDTIVHFAAESHVDRSIAGPDAFIETNVTGTHELLKAAKGVWLDQGSGRPHHFHHISTDEVYGSLSLTDDPFTEESPYAPNSPYSASKAASDHLVRAYNRTYGLRTTISNCSNNFGPFQFPEKLIPLFFINCLYGRPLPIYGDGKNIRDWLFVADHCRAIDSVLEKGRSGETYNIGGGSEIQNLTIVELICRCVDELFETNPGLAQRFPLAPPARGEKCESLKTFVNDRRGHDRRYAISGSKADVELGFKPMFEFEDALKATLRWYLSHEPWWQGLIRSMPLKDVG